MKTSWAYRIGKTRMKKWRAFHKFKKKYWKIPRKSAKIKAKMKSYLKFLWTEFHTWRKWYNKQKVKRAWMFRRNIGWDKFLWQRYHKFRQAYSRVK